jgi:HAD superfamily hydrolase (TIGR01549 family)
MRPAILCDLDGTILDTSTIQEARDRRRWKECVLSRESTSVYGNLDQVFSELRDLGCPIVIVTSSVSYYAENLLAHHKVHYDFLVAWHDTESHKPHPEPYLKALRLLSTSPEKAVGIGDKLEDAQALKACNVRSLAAGWNSDYEKGPLWDYVLKQPEEILRLLE